MKRYFWTLLMMFMALQAGAQQKKQEVIASSGGYNVASGSTISISWTLGETIIPTTTLTKEINMQDLPSGIYYLRILKGKLVNVYKVV